jgi:hypothetical protein
MKNMLINILNYGLLQKYYPIINQTYIILIVGVQDNSLIED